MPQPVEVEFYSGYRRGETPRRIICGGRVYPVTRVISRRRILERESGRLIDEFRCRIRGRTIILRVSGEGGAEMIDLEGRGGDRIRPEGDPPSDQGETG